MYSLVFESYLCKDVFFCNNSALNRSKNKQKKKQKKQRKKKPKKKRKQAMSVMSRYIINTIFSNNQSTKTKVECLCFNKYNINMCFL